MQEVFDPTNLRDPDGARFELADQVGGTDLPSQPDDTLGHLYIDLAPVDIDVPEDGRLDLPRDRHVGQRLTPSGSLGSGPARLPAAVRLAPAAEGWPFGRARAAVRLGGAFAELRVVARLVCFLARPRGAGVVRADERAEDASPESFPSSPRSSDPAIRPASLAGASDSRAAD